MNVPRIGLCFRNPILCGVICLHVDDTLGTGDEKFELKMNDLDQLVGFGSMKRHRFDRRGRQYEKYGDDKVTISMKSCILNLTKRSLPLERTKQLDNDHTATESLVYRGINRSLLWIKKEFLHPSQFIVKVLQRRQGQARARDLVKANEVVDEVKPCEDISRVFALKCGLIGVSDASLGGVDHFVFPTEQDRNIANVQSQAGVGIFI